MGCIARRIGVVLLVASLFVPARAHADAKEQARAAYDGGSTEYNLGNYDKALEHFRTAYRLVHEPALLFNIGQCQRQLGDYDGASKSYRAYLREASDVSEDRRAEVQKLVDTMELALKDKRAQQPPTGTQPLGTTKQEPVATPTNHSAHDTAPLTITSPVPVAPAPVPVYKRAWFWGVIGGAVVVVAVGVGLGVGLSQGTTWPSGPNNTAGTVRW
jgi:hypothetical protein